MIVHLGLWQRDLINMNKSEQLEGKICCLSASHMAIPHVEAAKMSPNGTMVKHGET
jgi:hypothetical protein